jgi:hypothetical protein
VGAFLLLGQIFRKISLAPRPFHMAPYAKLRGRFDVRWCGSIGHLADVFSYMRLVWLGSPEGEPVKPQERDELAKHQKLGAINDRLAYHDRKMQVTLLVVVLLNVVILALLAYLLLGQD